LEKTITLQGLNGWRVIFKGERNVILNCIILAMTTGKMIQKGSEAYVAFMMDARKEKNVLMNLFIVRQFPNVFPRELPGLPSKKKVEVSIYVLLGTSHIAQSPYRMAHIELVELKIQLKMLLHK
jgi:hypothetical protein